MKKVFEKKFSAKYFSSDEKNSVENFDVLFSKSGFLENVRFSKNHRIFYDDFFSSLEKYFSENFFSKLFLFS